MDEEDLLAMTRSLGPEPMQALQIGMAHLEDAVGMVVRMAKTPQMARVDDPTFYSHGRLPTDFREYLMNASLLNRVNHAIAMKMDTDSLATVHRILAGKYIRTNQNAVVGMAYEELIRSARRGWVIGHAEHARVVNMEHRREDAVRLKVCSFWKVSERSGCVKGMTCDCLHMVTRAYRETEVRGNR